MSPHDARPSLLKVGICLLALHDVLVLAFSVFAALVGTVLFVIGSWGAGEPTLIVLVAAVAAAVLAAVVTLAGLSLGVCAMAWRGARAWVGGLILVALLNCIVIVPNPLSVLAAVLCVVGGLQRLDEEPEAAMIQDEPGSAADTTP